VITGDPVKAGIAEVGHRAAISRVASTPVHPFKGNGLHCCAR
jgi:hypothetical protein